MENNLKMAEQQIYGWQCAKSGERIEGLVAGMGLTRKEWESLKNDGCVDYLPGYVKEEIDTYLSKRK